MAERDGHESEGRSIEDPTEATPDELDRELTELFGAFDDVRASEELKASTLAAIFAEMDGQDGEAIRGEDSVEAPSFGLVQGGASAHADEAKADAASAAAAYKKTARERRPRGFWPRVAAAALIITLTTGGIAYAIPASHVTVTSDDARVDLAVNVFGRTISFTTDDDGLQAALEGASVRGARYDDALERIFDVCDERAAAHGATGSEANASALAVEVNGLFAGEGGSMTESVNRVAEEHAKERQPVTPNKPAAPDQGEAETDDARQGAAETSESAQNATEQSATEEDLTGQDAAKGKGAETNDAASTSSGEASGPSSQAEEGDDAGLPSEGVAGAAELPDESAVRSSEEPPRT